MKENKKTLILTCAICLLPMVLGVVLYGKLPEQMPIHWNAVGEVDGYAPKAVAVFGLPAFLLVLQLIVCAGVLNDPKKQNQSKVMRLVGLWAVPVISMILEPITLLVALGHDIPIDIVTALIVGILFIICGNYLPKSRQNYTIGIKLPWTLDDVDNWNKTHRLAGVLWIICGILFIVSPFLPGNKTYLIVVILAMVLVPTGYSFCLYQKKKKTAE